MKPKTPEKPKRLIKIWNFDKREKQLDIEDKQQVFRKKLVEQSPYETNLNPSECNHLIKLWSPTFIRDAQGNLKRYHIHSCKHCSKVFEIR